MLKCSACAKFMTRNDGAVCHKCSCHYHPACVGFSTTAVIPRDWKCPTCKRSQPRDNKAETPVRGLLTQTATALSVAADPAAVAAAADPARVSARTSPAPSPGGEAEEGQSALGREIRLFREELQVVRQEFREFRQEFVDVRASLTVFTERLETLDGRVDALERQVANSTVSVAHKAMEEAIATLQMELRDRDQELLANDVQISNVPEEPGEISAGLAKRICAVVGVELDARDVVSVHRAGRVREAGRPRPLVLRLARRAVRDELLQGARVRRGATTADLGLAAAPQRFYVNERLTSENRQLFQRAREAARAAAWRYVWTRDGKIFSRQADGQPSHRLRRLTDLAIFGSAVAVQNVT